MAPEQFLEWSLEEMGRHPLLELADVLSGEADRRNMEEGDAGPFIERLTAFLQGKDHVLIGGLAVRAYVRVRPTKDFDVMIAPRHWDDMRRFLAGEAAQATGAVEDTFTYTFPGFRMDLDVRLAKSPLDVEALSSFVERPYRDKILRVVRPEYLVAMKVKAYAKRKDLPKGQQDRADVKHLVGQKLADATSVREVLTKHRMDLLAEFEEILRATLP